MSDGKLVYFASDFHLGLQGTTPSIARERRIVAWLRSIGPSAGALYLLGDVFDFWYEYRGVVPKGFVRFLGMLAEFTDAGIPVHIFTGNHDVWMFDYLETEIGVHVHRRAETVQLLGHTFYLCHGDGLGPSGTGYKLLRAAFHSYPLQRIFATLHPSFAMWLGHTWSHKSRYGKQLTHAFRGEREPVVQFATAQEQKTPIDCFVMGHLHMALIHALPLGGQLVVLGDWITNDTYATWDGGSLRLMRYKGPDDAPEELAAATLPFRGNR